ncbi:XerD/XerC family integrase [Halapricum desulfuricans]|uniref:XerD/XerC family integrase n=1 Tax=Halapricum desulfuricans TaxID=2841257 RepID=A0A897NG21_9EURY|nr:site-specific integrase [Halapricum desulfuricans]QSG11384.1 XerD/XerC family integrase [Halapricum desulfuricans]
MDLKQTPPHDAKQRYLKKKRSHVSDKTIYNYDTALKRFLEFLTERGITDMRNVDSDEIVRFESWRLDSVKPITARNDMRTIKNFIEFCETIQASPVGLHELVTPTKVSEDDEISDDILTKQEAAAVLPHLGTYNYASPQHITVLILWKTGMRLSGLRTLDVGDFDNTRPALEIRHRPDTSTPLKRKHKSERDVLLTDDTATIIEDYLTDQRPDVTDDHGRDPLLASTHGRISRTGIQKHVYTATRPCTYNGGTCPFEKDPETCEAMQYDRASKCPGSVSPHALRRGYVTAARNAGQPKDVTGERVNMSGPILEKHYDKGTYDEKAERRREHIKEI